MNLGRFAWKAKAMSTGPSTSSGGDFNNILKFAQIILLFKPEFHMKTYNLFENERSELPKMCEFYRNLHTSKDMRI